MPRQLSSSLLLMATMSMMLLLTPLLESASLTSTEAIGGTVFNSASYAINSHGSSNSTHISHASDRNSGARRANRRLQQLQQQQKQQQPHHSADSLRVSLHHSSDDHATALWAVHAARNLSSWRSNLFIATEQFIVSKGNNDVPPDWQRFELFQPFITCPPGRPLRRVGPPGDGGKWLCEPATLKEPCTVISMGSNMDFRFEEAILNETRCRVVTLDCTVPGKTLSYRHTFRKLCVGSTAAERHSPDTHTTYARLVSSLGVMDNEVAVLKIDVESFEYPTLGELREHSHALPAQISLEVHYNECIVPDSDPSRRAHMGRGPFTTHDLALFFFHLSNLGYGIVNQEPNEACTHCSEFTLLRVEATVVHSKWN